MNQIYVHDALSYRPDNHWWGPLMNNIDVWRIGSIDLQALANGKPHYPKHTQLTGQGLPVIRYKITTSAFPGRDVRMSVKIAREVSSVMAHAEVGDEDSGTASCSGLYYDHLVSASATSNYPDTQIVTNYRSIDVFQGVMIRNGVGYFFWVLSPLANGQAYYPGISQWTEVTGAHVQSSQEIIPIAVAGAGRIIRGRIAFSARASNAPSQLFTFTFRLSGLPDIVKTAMVNTIGEFTMSDLPPSNYTVYIKGVRFLASNVNINSGETDISGIIVPIRAGDVDDNNVVNSDDLSHLLSSYGSARGEGVYELNPSADFDQNGFIDVDDLANLLNNYNVAGNA